MSRIGILGGTFDPVHLGHLASGRHTAAAFDLDRVLLVLSARPPHKPERRPATDNDRLAMLELAAGNDSLFEVSDLEVRRSGPSYMIDTLHELRTKEPNAELFLILGVDAYSIIDTWHRSGELLAQASIIVTTRPGEPGGQGAPRPPVAARESCCYHPPIDGYTHSSGHTLRAHTIDGLEISASRVRADAARSERQGLSTDARIEALTPLTGRAVAAYIVEHNLYTREEH